MSFLRPLNLPDKRVSIAPILTFGVLATGLTLYYFWNAVSELLAKWETPEYSYGYFVVPIALLLALHRLSAGRPAPEGAWIGLPVIALGLATEAAIELSGRVNVAQYSLILTTVGILLSVYGRTVVRSIGWALAYLVFAVPLPEILYSSLSTQLQLVSTTLGVETLYQLGVPAYQEGNIIDLGGYKLQVVEACSGLRYLFPLLSFSFLIAYIMDSGWIKRTVLFFSAIPIAIGMNSLRIAMIGVTVDLWGSKMAEGLLHDFEGWSVFILCVGILLLETWLLGFIGKKSGFLSLDVFQMPRGPFLQSPPPPSRPALTALVLLGGFSAAMAAGVFKAHDETFPAHRPLAGFPLTLGDWSGHHASLSDRVLEILRPTDYVLADYTSGSNSTNFYVAFYDSQRDAAPHSPEMCIPGGGWSIVSLTQPTVSLSADGATRDFKIKRALIKQGSQRQIVYFWLVERGRMVTSDFMARWYLFLDPIKTGRTDGALIRLVTPLASGESEDAGDARLQNFMNASLPTLGAYIPMTYTGE